MKKSFDTPEVIAAVLTVLGTFLVSVILGFLEGRVGLKTLIGLFAILALGALLFFLYKRTGPKVTTYATTAMILVGFLGFLGCRGITFLYQTAVSSRAAEPTAIIDSGPVQPVAQVQGEPTAALLLTADLLPTADLPPTAAPTLAEGLAPTEAEQPTIPVAPTTAPVSILRGQWTELQDLPRLIADFAYAPAPLDTAYAATTGGIYQSADHGATWTLAPGSLPDQPTALGFASGVARLYALVSYQNVLYASDDGAQSWARIGETHSFGSFDLALTFTPDGLTGFALLDTSGLYITYDGGAVWATPGVGLPGKDNETYVRTVVYDPFNQNIVYAGTGGFVGDGHGVYKSTDAGQTWQASNKGMLDYRITALAIDPANSQVIYAGAEMGELWKSEDGGAKWRDLTNELKKALPLLINAIEQIAVDPQDSNSIFVLADQAGLFYSANGGDTWRYMGGPTGNDQPFFESSRIFFAPEATVLVSMQDKQPWVWKALP